MTHYINHDPRAAADPRDASRALPYSYQRYSFGIALAQGQPSIAGAGLHYEDNMGVMMNLLTMIFSMCAMLMKIKWCGWAGVVCAVVGYTSARSIEDARQILSSALLGVSAIIMSYMHTPGPLSQS